MRISSIKPDVIALRELYKGEASSLHIPSNQRQFVWDSEDVKELIDSIVNGYPIGAVIICRRGRSCRACIASSMGNGTFVQSVLVGNGTFVQSVLDILEVQLPDRTQGMTHYLLLKVRPWEFGSSPMREPGRWFKDKSGKIWSARSAED